jgi:predicted acyltransferase
MTPANRLISLDIFRGAAIAGMILASNPGSWSYVYPPLRHAVWHGATPADWIFPFFLFILGAAIPLSLGRRLDQGATRAELAGKVWRRAVILFAFGLFLAAFPDFGLTNDYAHLAPLHYSLLGMILLVIFLREILDQPQYQNARNAVWRRRLGYLGMAAASGMLALGFFAYDLGGLRIPGILQRVALVYGVCGFLYLRFGRRAQLWVGAALLLFYWALLALVPVPGGQPPNLDPETNLGAWIDRTLLGVDHLHSQSRTWDPESLLGALPAIASGLIGMLAGEWMRKTPEPLRLLSDLMVGGAVLLALGLVWNAVFPINKNLWTSSFVLYTSGIALLCFGVVYWLVDIKGYIRWAKPFAIFGVNPLFVYIFSSLTTSLMYTVRWIDAAGAVQTPQAWVYHHLLRSWLGPLDASLGYALLQVFFCLAAAWALYQNRVYIKV